MTYFTALTHLLVTGREILFPPAVFRDLTALVYYLDCFTGLLSCQLGHLVSRRCAELIPKLVVESGLSLERAAARMSDDLRTCAVDCSSSGATLVLAIIQGGKVGYSHHNNLKVN